MDGYVRLQGAVLLVMVAAILASGATAQAAARGASAPDPARSEMARLARSVPHFHTVTLPAKPGELTLTPGDSLTIENLRGVTLDDKPPVVGTPATPYEPNQSDDFAPGTAPYVAKGIRPFRFRDFTLEFNYTGWHNFKMMEYAATHGFSVISPYVLKERQHFPAGTRWLKWGGWPEWTDYFKSHNIAWGRFDRLSDMDLVPELLRTGNPWQPGPQPDRELAMLDLEHGGPLAPEELRRQDWYPKGAAEAEQQAFERKYYHGYALTYTAPVEALRRAGWKSVGVYPQPYGSGWYALLNLAQKGQSGLPDPRTHWPWLRYGREMVAAQDVLYPDVYVYYWSPQNVAYTLARLDFDRTLIASLPAPKPIRPYFWPLLHGGDADYHWWSQQPLPNEDERAIYALCLFAGCDGAVLWNWSDVGNHHAPPPLLRQEGGKTTGADVMVGSGFALRPEGANADTPLTRFHRYDVLAIADAGEQTGVVRFHRIDTVQQQGGPRPGNDAPLYAMQKNDLLPHLRPTSEPVAAAVEGLALAKPFEYILRHGAMKVDVPALDQFAKTLPIVRRVKLGRINLVATYDPLPAHGGAARAITLPDFDGRRGLTVKLPADEQVRIFVLTAPA